MFCRTGRRCGGREASEHVGRKDSNSLQPRRPLLWLAGEECQRGPGVFASANRTCVARLAKASGEGASLGLAHSILRIVRHSLMLVDHLHFPSCEIGSICFCCVGVAIP